MITVVVVGVVAVQSVPVQNRLPLVRKTLPNYLLASDQAMVDASSEVVLFEVAY